VLALLLLFQSSSPATTVEGRGSPTAEIPRVEAAVRIDGVLDEPVWSQATRLTGFWQYQPVDGRPAEERTEVPSGRITVYMYVTAAILIMSIYT
jgi:hypothetical protein